MCSSRLTMAAWQVMPPASVTTPAARRIAGTQSGEVIGATSTSPSLKVSICETLVSTRTLPERTPGDAPRPASKDLPGAAAPDSAVSVVIGRVCTRKNFPPSSAHSMSCGTP
jgi:hypothetical protein